MNPNSIEQGFRPESKKEPASFDDYRTFCDREADAFRKLGILDQTGYEASLEDPRTVFCKIEDQVFPILAPLEYESRYNQRRTSEMTGKDDVLLLTIPLAKMREGLNPEDIIFGSDFPEDPAILIEEIIGEDYTLENRQADHEAVAELFDSFGVMTPHEFIDERLANSPNNSTAWMGIFRFSVESNREISEEMKNLPIKEAWEKAWEQYCEEKGMDDLPGEDANGTYLYTDEKLKENPDVADSLWATSEIGFGEVLGKNHPVSMEVSKNFFDQRLQTEGIFTGARYQNDELKCFGMFTPNGKRDELEHSEWFNMNSTVIKKIVNEANEAGKTMGHFFELISRGERELGLSTGVIGLFMEIASRTRPKWEIVFESTNLSATYVPRIVAAQTKRSEDLSLTEPVEMLSRLDYWYLTKANNN